MDSDQITFALTLVAFLFGYGYPQNLIRRHQQARRNREAWARGLEEERERILAADVDEMGERLYQERLRQEAWLLAADMRRY